jgi:hypothetical protein
MGVCGPHSASGKIPVAVNNSEKQVASRRMPGQVSLSFWRGIRNALSFGNSRGSTPRFAWQGQGLRPRDFPAELRGLIDVALAARERILANRFLRGWIRWSAWILVGLLVAAAISPRLAIPLISAAVGMVLAAVVIGLGTWRTRPSAYEVACKLDSAAGLHDRLSTAIYFGTAGSPDEMVLCQRQDALKHLTRVNPRALFAIRLPVSARRSVMLAMAVAGLLAYRVYYQPPVTALLQAMARSQTVQSVLDPLKQTVQQDIERILALANQTVDAMNEQMKQVDANASRDDLWKANEQDEAEKDTGANQMLPGDSSDSQQGQPGEQNGPQMESQSGMNSQNAQQQGNQASSQNSQSNGSNAKANSQQQQNAGNSQSGHESLTQSLIQALKNLLSNSQTQQRSDGKSSENQRASSQGAPQSTNSQQQGSERSGDKQQQSGGYSDVQQKMTKENGAGAGNQPGYKEMKKNDDEQVAKTLAERVALENNGSNENVRVRMPTETGAAKVPLGNASPSGVAVVKGAEQENVPARYRSYVQRYFEHSNSGSR